MPNILKKRITRLGLDPAIALTILTRLIQVGGNVISIIFIAKFLNADEQGYYYTFASILAIQVFFELGLSGIITQYTAHEFAHLKWQMGELEGDMYYKSRLSSLLRFCVKWFAIISIFLFIALVIVGFYFFKNFDNTSSINWQMPWIILCLATSLNLFIDPLLAYFDGLGEVRDMAKVRLVQKTFTILLLIFFFGCGFKLYSSALASLFSILINYFQILFSSRKKILLKIWKLQDQWKIDYLGEIFPLQWKIALSWISGYFIFQLFNPVIFATEGPKLAGQMGMTLQALNGISAIAMSWITTKVPLFSSLVAKKEYVNLDKIFNTTVKQVFVITIVMTVVFILGVASMNFLKIELGHRFLNVTYLTLLSVTVIVNQIVFAWATYLRCHKREPFVFMSITVGILCCLSTFILGHRFGINGIIYGYTFLIIFVSFLWSLYIFNKKKLEWHGNI